MDRNETLHAVRSTVIFESFVQVDAQITTSSGTLQLGDPLCGRLLGASRWSLMIRVRDWRASASK